MRNYTGVNKKKIGIYDSTEFVQIYADLIFTEFRINFGRRF